MNLRLLITPKCYYTCEKCTNKHWNLTSLPICKPETYEEYKNISLTGGEPLFEVDKFYNTLNDIRKRTSKPDLFLYTSYTLSVIRAVNAFSLMDGVTFSLHHQTDVIPLMRINAVFLKKFPDSNLSLRLKIFPEVKVTSHLRKMFKQTGWQIEDTIWLDRCFLPEDEVFMRIADAFK